MIIWEDFKWNKKKNIWKDVWKDVFTSNSREDIRTQFNSLMIWFKKKSFNDFLFYLKLSSYD